MAGVDLMRIVYKGTGAALNDLLGGQVQMAVAGAVASIPHVKSGRLRALGIGDSKRSAFLPDVPTIAEAGVPGYQATIWTGLLGPAKLPPALVQRLNREVVRIVQAQEFKDRLLSMGSDAAGTAPEEFGKFIEAEMNKWGKIARAAGLKPE